MQDKGIQRVEAVSEAGIQLDRLDWKRENPAIAVQIHVFFTEVIGELLEAVNAIPYAYDCYISTDTAEKKKRIEEEFVPHCTAGQIRIEIFPNRGRDVAPFLMQMKDVINDYKYIAHLHTKKSETVDFGDQWRRFLYENVCGGRAYLLALFERMERGDKLGLIIPPFYPVIEKGAKWAGTKSEIELILKRVGGNVLLPKEPVFPAGTMFWAKTAAVRPLFELGYTQEDFPDEAGQVNDTLAHVIERIWVYLAEGQGYTYRICRNAIEEKKEEEACEAPQSRIMLYAHYDREDRVSDLDLESLKAMRSDVDELVFISNSRLTEKEKKKVAGVSDRVWLRENKGYDFGAWKYGMERLGFDYLAEFGQVILMNNSSVGPIYGLKMVFDRMRREQKDFWGITLYPYCADGSFINEPYIPEHIQSYFVVFNQNVVQSEVFRNFWKEYRPSDDFTETVARGETKLTPMLVQGGFTYGAYLPESRDLVQWFQTGQPQNELAYQYAVLGSPFLKKKAVYFLTIENRKKLLSYLEQLPVPECYAEFFSQIPEGAEGGSNTEKKPGLMLRGARLFRREGIRGVSRKLYHKTYQKLRGPQPQPEKSKLIEYYTFATNRTPIPLNREEYETHREDSVKILNWIIPDMGEGSGGHINMFRFISRLEDMGFHSRLYLFQSLLYQDDAHIRGFLAEKFPMLDSRVEVYQDVSSMGFAHGTIATFWQTAYYLRRFENTLSKFYFIQDYEPAFYAPGSDYELADATYRFGFRGITAGDWLKELMTEKYGMQADSFGFSYDRDTYVRKEKKSLKKRVFFYARPVTPRRDFEIGFLALQELCSRRKDVEIIFAGWDVSDYVIPFPHKNLGILPVSRLSEVYADCELCLVLSHTNLSLLPLEIMASGSVAVCSKGRNSSWLVNETNAVLVEYSVKDIADKLEYYLTHERELEEIRERGIAFAQSTSWDKEAEKVRDALLKGITEDEEK